MAKGALEKQELSLTSDEISTFVNTVLTEPSSKESLGCQFGSGFALGFAVKKGVKAVLGVTGLLIAVLSYHGVIHVDQHRVQELTSDASNGIRKVDLEKLPNLLPVSSTDVPLGAGGVPGFFFGLSRG